jgi:hypothetical protein
MALKQARAVGDEAVVQPDQEVLDGMGGGAAVVRVNTADVALGGFAGDTDDIRIKLPFLQIASGQGRLDKFVKGSVVIGSESLIAGPGEPVLITLLSVQTFWKEYTSGADFDPNYIPKTYATKADVIKAGGTVEWSAGKPPSYKTAGVMRLLVKQPQGVVCGLFGVPVGDALYAPVQWGVDKTAAQETLPVIKRDMSFSLNKRGMLAGIYELRTKVVKFSNGHSTFAPSIKLVAYHTDEEIAQIKSLFAGAAQAQASDESEIEVKM